MINKTKWRLYRIRNKWSRSRLLAKWLDLPVADKEDNRPGLIMIQVDGLSINQFAKALKHHKMNFLSRLIKNQKFALKTFYSGIPSTTPAVQAELFFGIPGAVPGFGFYTHENGQKCFMYMPECAGRVSHELKRKGEPLLAGGASYSNIYTGGADEARYCIENMGLDSLLQALNPLKWIIMIMVHVSKIVRIIGYTAIEFFLALTDFLRGIIEKRNLIKELKFIPTRIGICIGLRELIRFRVKMDISRGVRIIHANFVGYDEQSHRRGPSSLFAHWSLKGIDRTIRDIWESARRSDHRSYRLIIYSDHGQEQVHAYHSYSGCSVHEAIEKAMANYMRQPEKEVNKKNYEQNMMNLRASGFLFKQVNHQNDYNAKAYGVRVIAPGPIGHVYLPATVSVDEKSAIALHLSKETKIPLIVFYDGQGVKAVCQHKIIQVEANPEKILGTAHPFEDQVIRDLANLCRHPDTGDFIILGWHPTAPPMSFAIENGAHGGIGREEVQGFVLLPLEINTKENGLRPLALRNLVNRYLQDS